MTDLKSRLTAKRKDVTGRWVSINPDGDDAVKEIERLEDCCTEWAEVSQGNYQAAKKAEAEVARLREALEWYGDKALLCRDDWQLDGSGVRALREDAGERAREALKGGDDE